MKAGWGTGPGRSVAHASVWSPMRGATLVLVVAWLLAALVGAADAAKTAAPACVTSRLVVWLNTNGDGAAGSVYYHLQFTNLATRACSLRGYPGVSGVDLGGRRIGTPAARNPSPVRTITLAGGATANAVLRIVNVGNFPASRCHASAAAGLRVFPPNQRASKVVPFPLRACTKTGVAYLFVGPVVT